MISGFFGVPRVGKSTRLAKIYKKNKNNYDHIYSVNITIKGCERITKEDFRNYIFKNSLILWDEITLDYDNRDFKSFTEKDKESWLLHGHYGTDIVYATQNYENVDKKIRDITQELWYMHKSNVNFPILKNFTISERIFRTIKITENNGDLVMGYRFQEGLEKIFMSNKKWDYRPLYYKYFDTHEDLTKDKREDYTKRKTNEEMNEIWQKNFGVSYQYK